MTARRTPPTVSKADPAARRAAAADRKERLARLAEVLVAVDERLAREAAARQTSESATG